MVNASKGWHWIEIRLKRLSKTGLMRVRIRREVQNLRCEYDNVSNELTTILYWELSSLYLWEFLSGTDFWPTLGNSFCVIGVIYAFFDGESS